MVRERNPNRDKAFEIYKVHKGNIKPKDIGEMLNITPRTISNWKRVDEWDKQIGKNKNKRGGQKGNKNAVGNKGGRGPKGNLNAFKHGNRIPPERFNSKSFLAKYLPKVTQNIMNDITNSGINSLDILWSNIEIHYTAIIRSQKIMHVKSNKDITKELKKISTGEMGRTQEYEIQFAWDKQERFLKAQSSALKTLMNLIKTYEELLNKNWDLATEEQKTRVELLKAQLNKSSGINEDINIIVDYGDNEEE